MIQCEQDESIFELSYEWEYEGRKCELTKRMTISLGDRLFKTVATFRVDGKVAANLPVAIGLTTHNCKATAFNDLNAGWIACWETIDGYDLGTGVLIDPEKIMDYKLIESETPDESHALILSKTNAKGEISWWAGYGWARAGAITTVGEWTAYLDGFSGALK